MPHQKNAKNNRHIVQRADHANNNVLANANERNVHNDQRMQRCCFPGACPVKEEIIDTENVGDAIRVVCINENCREGNWMHKSCFESFEENVLSYLRSCGRARSWSEKQRLQNLWTKKGYDLAYKACDCNCGRGHLRKDLDYVAPLVVDNAAAKKKHKKKTAGKPELNTGTVPTPTRERRPSGNNNTNANAQNAALKNVGMVTNAKVDTTDAVKHSNHIRKASPSISIINNRNEDRLRANSISSTGSSPPNSASSVTSGSDSPVPPSPQNSNVSRMGHKSKFHFSDHFSSPDNSPSNFSAASIFAKRCDLSAFSILPKHKQNPYHIKMEDDALSGTDDVHTFVLNHLSSYRITTLHCLLCKNELCVFDRYPLVDGSLFLSPQAYDNEALQVISDGRLQYINAVCVGCLEGGNDVRCVACKRKWDGSSLLLGSMYAYDIFAAMPCCQKRLTCKHCRRAVVDVSSGLPYYSEYSRMIPCPYCKAYDYHFIRPLCDTFSVKMSIWK